MFPRTLLSPESARQFSVGGRALSAVFLAIAALAAGCGSSSKTSGADAASDVDAAETALSASNYCERIAPFFCEFYLRCGRMDVESTEACEPNFLESCNSKYEGAYIELEELGFMELSEEGLSECESHLETVSCEEQFFELSGPCANLWAGKRDVGESCGLDAEFFTCDASSECVLSLDFCGTCFERVPVGGACTPGEQTCGAVAFCSDGVCVARKVNGDACGKEDRCVAGSSCVEGLCSGPSIVALGDSCDRANRCPYLTECVGGTCVRAVLQGESCSATVPCATGYCQAGTCVAPQENGNPCTGAAQCRSLLCGDGSCQPRPSGCMQ